MKNNSLDIYTISFKATSKFLHFSIWFFISWMKLWLIVWLILSAQVKLKGKITQDVIQLLVSPQSAYILRTQ